MAIIEKEFSRRALLQGAGAMVVAVSIPTFALSGGTADAATPAGGIGPANVDGTLLDSWLAIGGDGKVTVFTGKEELGTGTATATLQIVADELDVAFENTILVEPDTWQTVDQGYSSGSQTLKTQWATGLRISAAEARLALVNMAADKLGVSADKLTVSNGVISVAGDSSKSVSYASLIGNQQFNLKITGKAKPKTPDQYKIIGTSVKRIDVPAKVLATFMYTQDVSVPGMLHGRVVRPPSLDAKLVSIDGFGKTKTPGLVKVVNVQNFIGVVTEREDQAITAAQALKVTWQTTPLPNFDTIYDDLRKQPSSNDRLMVNTGDVDKALSGATKTLAATYKYPYQMHGSMGASCSVADVQSDRATIWTSSQGVYQLRGALATLLSMPAQNVHVIYVEGSGCYGLNGADNASLDAALMSQATGKPVRVQYMRHDEHGWENYGNLMTLDVKAGLDDKGNVVAWSYENWSAGRGSRPGPPGNVPTGVLAGFPETPFVQAKPLANPLPAVAYPGPDNSNTMTLYNFPNHRALAHSVVSRFFSGPLRAPARIQNTFANESFIDELAAAAHADPLAFRLKLLTDQRMIDVLNTAAKLANWVSRPSPKGNSSTSRYLTGRGMSAVQYEGVGNAYSAVIADVTVDTKTGKVKVDHVWASQDCGICINPDGMRAQAEGCVIQGVSRSLKEELKWTAQKITTQDWATYPVLRFPEMPTFDFSIVNRKDQPAVGAGEVVVTAVPAAIGNAIFDATGKRLRQVPFTPSRVRAALAAD